MREKIAQPPWMQVLLLLIPFILGTGLVLYGFAFDGIASRHSVTNYMMLCTGFLCISIGCVGMAVADVDVG